MREPVGMVFAFYQLLGDKRWIFHDSSPSRFDASRAKRRAAPRRTRRRGATLSRQGSACPRYFTDVTVTPGSEANTTYDSAKPIPGPKSATRLEPFCVGWGPPDVDL
ncbi:hypothetical protein [Streptomyces zaomyceticus]|uniref:hypothetical protein n=1 Tax=Streptomyces zaomyceticus TaxID=68286 RepID=UPI0033B01778